MSKKKKQLKTAEQKLLLAILIIELIDKLVSIIKNITQ